MTIDIQLKPFSIHAELWVGDRLLIDHLGWEDSIRSLEKAIKRIDAAFHPKARQYKAGSIDYLIFEGGPSYIKFDGLGGICMWILFSELLKRAKEKYSDITLTLTQSAPEPWKKYITKNLNIKIIEKYETIVNYQNMLRRDRSHKISSILSAIIKPIISRNICCKKSLSIPLAFITTNEEKFASYGDAPKMLSKYFKIIGLRVKEKPWRVSRAYTGNLWSSLAEATALTAINSLTLALRLWIREKQLLREVAKYDDMLAVMMRHHYGSFYMAALHYITTENLLRKVKPAFLVSNGNYNNPHEARLNIACKAAGVPSINVCQRYASDHIPAMVFDYNRDFQFLPDRFVTFRKKSSKKIQDWGVPPNLISIGDRHASSKPEKTPTDSKEESKKISVLLFLDDPSVNSLIIPPIVDAIKKSGANLKVRSHPKHPILNQKNNLEHLSLVQWENVSDIPLDEVITPYCTVSVSPCSSIGIDAAQKGAAILWLPFAMGSHSLFAEDLLSTTGEKFLSPECLTQRVLELTSNSTLCRDVCQNHFEKLNETPVALHVGIFSHLKSIGFSHSLFTS